jgi:acetyl esterase/lipase
MLNSKFMGIIALVASAASSVAEPISLADFTALPRSAPTFEVHYGVAQTQSIDVFIPANPGAHPVAILIHGGCWSALPNAGREQLRHVGSELAKSGIAVWSIGYRRANEPGGGYPGTYLDVATAVDLLRSVAPRHNLDLKRTVMVGHSAGGHLALWAAGRRNLPDASRLRTDDPFVSSRVISLAGIGDIKAFGPHIPLICGSGIAERLTNPTSAVAEDAYADVSPAQQHPPEAHVVMISGVLDRWVPPYIAHDYARAMKDKGKSSVALINVAGAGHFDLVTPGNTAWEEVRLQIDAALAP